MADYYFDIETDPSEETDYKNDKILTIQYQPIDCRTGETKGGLVILKSWESSERDILERFYKIFKPEEKWSFIPVGFNLIFDHLSLLYRWRAIGINVKPTLVLSERPNIDLKSVAVLCNGGVFKGASLGRFAGKKDSGTKVAEWCKNGNYAAAEEYIKDEADSFLSLYKYMVSTMPQHWEVYARANGIIV